jgi:hypothetical protein
MTLPITAYDSLDLALILRPGVLGDWMLVFHTPPEAGETTWQYSRRDDVGIELDPVEDCSSPARNVSWKPARKVPVFQYEAAAAARAEQARKRAHHGHEGGER